MSQHCAICKIIRTYLLFAVPLLALVGASTMGGGLGSATPWFARVELIDLLSWGCLAALILIVSYRAYEEYYLPRKRERALAEAKAKFDEAAAQYDEREPSPRAHASRSEHE
tara:strand:- start:2235 stop:2570 length:336 start_codon:yes stop_codon:yes gene_type:complete